MTARVNMRDRVKIGQQWQRNRGGDIGVIRQIHRADREVELLGVEGVRFVSFTDLRRKWTELSTVGPNQPTRPELDTPAMPAAPNTNATVQAPSSGTAGPPSRAGRFRLAPAHINVRCRCHLAPPSPGETCQHCHGTGHRTLPDLWDRTPGRSDLQVFTDTPTSKEPIVPLPQTKTSREGRDPRDARVLLVAPPKTGKTTLAAAWAPDTTLILDTHQGTRLLDGEHYVQAIQTFKDFEAAIDEITAGGHQFRTVVIDLIEHVYKMAEDQAARQFNQVAAALVEYGKGTGYAEAIFRRAIDKLLTAPLGVWFLSHVETIQDGNQITYIPKIDKKVRTYIEGSTDFCLLAEIKGTTRQLQTAPSTRYQIGCRVPLPNPMPLDARNLYVEIAKGLAKPKPQPAAPVAPAPAPVQTQQPKEPIAA